jgi:hypothetical protein
MELLHSLLNVATALLELLAAVAQTAWPWVPLFAWIAFWSLAVDWTKLAPILAKGGIIGVVLIALMAILVWSVIAPPPDGVHHILGLSIQSAFTAKMVYVVGLIVIAALCGSVQLSGCCASLTHFDEPALVETHAEHEHGESHGHDAGADH